MFIIFFFNLIRGYLNSFEWNPFSVTVNIIMQGLCIKGNATLVLKNKFQLRAYGVRINTLVLLQEFLPGCKKSKAVRSK